MKYAIFSDVHNNAPTLSKVLLDAAQRDVDAYLCLGDLGTEPSIKLAQSVNAQAVFGNWEPTGHQHLTPAAKAWTLALPPMRKYPNFWISHATPTWPANVTTLKEYLKVKYQLSFSTIFPYYTAPSDALWQAFSTLLEAKIPVLFHGHTHKQVTWLFSDTNNLSKDLSRTLTLQAENYYVIGVGSVGQPKDSNRPSYVIFNASTKEVSFIRI